jgi:hypothetical protein
VTDRIKRPLRAALRGSFTPGKPDAFREGRLAATALSLPLPELVQRFRDNLVRLIDSAVSFSS